VIHASNRPSSADAESCTRLPSAGGRGFSLRRALGRSRRAAGAKEQTVEEGDEGTAAAVGAENMEAAASGKIYSQVPQGEAGAGGVLQRLYNSMFVRSQQPPPLDVSSKPSASSHPSLTVQLHAYAGVMSSTSGSMRQPSGEVGDSTTQEHAPARSMLGNPSRVLRPYLFATSVATNSTGNEGGGNASETSAAPGGASAQPHSSRGMPLASPAAVAALHQEQPQTQQQLVPGHQGHAYHSFTTSPWRMVRDHQPASAGTAGGQGAPAVAGSASSHQGHSFTSAHPRTQHTAPLQKLPASGQSAGPTVGHTGGYTSVTPSRSSVTPLLGSSSRFAASQQHQFAAEVAAAYLTQLHASRARGQSFSSRVTNVPLAGSGASAGTTHGSSSQMSSSLAVPNIQAQLPPSQVPSQQHTTPSAPH
jgi:hypothetical protein